jgi:hypothetical protein
MCVERKTGHRSGCGYCGNERQLEQGVFWLTEQRMPQMLTCHTRPELSNTATGELSSRRGALPTVFAITVLTVRVRVCFICCNKNRWNIPYSYPARHCDGQRQRLVGSPMSKPSETLRDFCRAWGAWGGTRHALLSQYCPLVPSLAMLGDGRGREGRGAVWPLSCPFHRVL